MNNKVLVEVEFPKIEATYTVFIPINKRIINVIQLLEKGVKSLSDDYYMTEGEHYLYKKETGLRYDDSLVVKETDIRNGSKLIIL